MTDLGPTQDSNRGHSHPKVPPTPRRFTPGEEPMLTHAKPQRPYRKQQEKYDKASALVSFASLSAVSGTL